MTLLRNCPDRLITPPFFFVTEGTSDFIFHLPSHLMSARLERLRSPLTSWVLRRRCLCCPSFPSADSPDFLDSCPVFVQGERFPRSFFLPLVPPFINSPLYVPPTPPVFFKPRGFAKFDLSRYGQGVIDAVERKKLPLRHCPPC